MARPRMTEHVDWDERFRSDDYLFGTEPSAFVVRYAAEIPPRARVLCIADGEGRNGAWLAGQGHRVTAFDGSVTGHDKALRLDADRGVRVERVVASLDDWEWGADRWDAILGVFVQFAPPDMRARMFRAIRDGLRPGGVLLLHGYTPRQLVHRTGGPGEVTQLYTPDLLRAAFGDWDVRVLQEYEREIVEGRGHAGMSALIDLIAVKPAGDLQG